MGIMFQENSFNFGTITRKALCATLSFAVLNASLASVYAMPVSSQSSEAIISEDSVRAPKRSQEVAQVVSQAAAPMRYPAWMLKNLENVADLAFEGSKGLVGLVARGISYAIKHPGEALVAGLATQIATAHAIRPVTDEFLINQNTTGIQTNPSIAALEDGNALVTWQGNQTKTYDILGRVFSATGAPLGDELTINQNTAGDQYYPSVTALNNGNAFVAWTNYNNNYIYGRGTNSTGVGFSNEVFIIQSSPPSLLLMSLNNGNIFIAWEGYPVGSDIFGYVLAPNGTVLTNNFLINQYYASGRQYDPSGAVLNNNNIFVTWQGTQTGNLDLYGRVMFPNGTAFSNEFTINQIVAGDQTKSSVAALGNDKILVVWQGDQAGNLDIYGRFFSESGAVLSNQLKINQVTDGNQANASVTALSDGNAFIVWDGDQTGVPSLYGRLMASNGTFLGDEVLLNPKTLTGIQIDPRVKLLKNGNILVAWTDDRAGTPDIYGRIFDPYSDPAVTTSQVVTTNLVSTATVTPETDPEKIL
ncbi:MAG: hypothetical protein ACRCYZ_02230, partial [Alphaproteobacteria bacterium]